MGIGTVGKVLSDSLTYFLEGAADGMRTKLRREGYDWKTTAVLRPHKLVFSIDGVINGKDRLTIGLPYDPEYDDVEFSISSPRRPGETEGYIQDVMRRNQNDFAEALAEAVLKHLSGHPRRG